MYILKTSKIDWPFRIFGYGFKIGNNNLLFCKSVLGSEKKMLVDLLLLLFTYEQGDQRANN